METVEVLLHYHESSLQDAQAVLKGSWGWFPSRFCDRRRIAVALGSPWSFEFEIRRDCNGKELIGPDHDEGFGAFGKIWIKHPGTCKAVRVVVHNVGGDFDT